MSSMIKYDFYVLQLGKQYVRDIYDELPGENNYTLTHDILKARRHRECRNNEESNLFHDGSRITSMPICHDGKLYTSAEASPFKVIHVKVEERETTKPYRGGFSTYFTRDVKVSEMNW